MTSVQQRAEDLDASTFFGVPIAGFENGGRQQLILLLMAGMEPNSMLVDLGCGVLRAGYWLIHFLDPGCYHGIEPHAGRLETGKNIILEPETLQVKRPRFDANASFDTSVFGTKFDYFLAYSIWTHASKPQIELMLDHFLRDSTPQAVFLTSIWPTGWRGREYLGDEWFGTSHESDVVGCIQHSLKWVDEQCRRRGLHMQVLGLDRDKQTWLSISRYKKKLLFDTIWSKPRWRRLAARLLRRSA